MNARQAPRFESLHFGPVGQLPGGIAQVVNVYVDLASDDWSVTAVRTTRGPRDWSSPWLCLVAALKLTTVWRERHRVLAVVHLSQGGSFLREGMIVFLAKILGIRSALTLHGSSFSEFAASRPRLCTAVLRAGDAVLVLSEEAYRSVTALLPTGNVVRIPNLVRVPSQVLPQTHRERTVLFAGEVSKRKGVDVLISAWRELEDRDGWTLRIVGPSGSGFDRSCLSSVSGVVDGGVATNSEIRLMQGVASIACLPSRAETLPMFILESMSSGCAVIGTSVGRVAEVLDRGAGCVVAPGSVHELKAALQRLISDPTARQELAEGARKRAQELAGPWRMEEIEGLWTRTLTR